MDRVDRIIQAIEQDFPTMPISGKVLDFNTRYQGVAGKFPSAHARSRALDYFNFIQLTKNP